VTQPSGPYEFDAVGQSGPYGATVFRPPPKPGAAAGEAAGGGDVPAIDWGAIQQSEAASADPAAARLAALREKQSVGQTVGDQFFRGVFDAILSPGALVGLGAESAGSALGIEALRDFGRDLGKASSGAVAADLLNELAGGRVGAAREDFAEQEEARPLLSTVARGSGMVGAGLAAGGASGAKAAIGVGALEGGAAGAQTAYEHNEALRDVLASTALGAAFGAAVPAGFVGVGKAYGAAKKALAGRASDAALSSSLKEAIGEFGQERGAKAIGFNPSAIRKLGRDAPAAEREMRQVVEDVMSHKLDDGTEVFQATQSQEDLAARIAMGREELGEKLGAMRARADDFIEKQAPALRPSPVQLASRIETEVMGPLASSNVPGVKQLAAEVQDLANGLREMGETTSLSQLRKFQEDLASVVYPRSPTGQLMPPTRDIRGLFKADRLIEDAVSSKMDEVARMMGEDAGYQALKRLDRSFITAAKVSGAEQLADMGRRAFSLSDTLAGVAAFGGDIATGGAISALKGIAAAGVHKVLRERSSSVLAVLSNRLARTPKPHFSVAQVGGREAQEALSMLAQARNFMRETGEAVGDNPSVRRVAESEAKNVIAERFAREAENYDVARWAERTPTPMQRVLHRKAILDTASADMAATAERMAALRSELPEALNVARLGKLMKDADKPAAIGAMHAKLTELANDAPPTPGGAELGYLLRRASDKLETAEAAEAMEIGHAVRVELARAGKIDDAMGLRQPTDAAGYDTARFDQAFNDRATSQLRDVLSADHFGEAGAHYGAATNRSEAHAKLADAAALREALRTADQRGLLPAALHDANEGILAAAQARAALTGEKLPAGLERELRKSEEMFAAGEEAATLDGRRMSRIFEHLDDTQPTAPDPQKAVWDAVAPEIDKLVPVIRSEAGQSTRGRYRPALARTAAKEATDREPLLPEEQRIEYDERLDQVAELMSDPRNMESLGADPEIAPIMGQKIDQFLTDVPKPKQDIRGKAFETMSSNDLRLAAAMYEATVKPLSVLGDFRAGVVDYDKVQYAWKQWPGLQVAVQAGILDVLQQDLDDEEREGLSDTMLTQLDYLAGFGGRLQASLDPAFSARIDTLNTPPEQAKPPSGGGALSSPKAEPTFTERVAGAQT
jgi:hypothetical protein